MKVFVDTNVLMELLLKRENYLAVRTLWIHFMKKGEPLYISYLTFANAAYLLKKGRDKEQLHELMRKVHKHAKVLSMNERQIKALLKCPPVRDFEDLLQYQCAKDNHCDSIVTFNKKDYYFADDITILTPDEFIRQIN